MKNGFIKVATASPVIGVGAVSTNKREHVRLAETAYADGASIVVFPELSLTGATAGDLFYQRPLLLAAEKALLEYKDETKSLGIVSFVGLPALILGRVYNVTAVVSGGELLALIPSENEDSRYFDSAPRETLDVNFAGEDTVFGTDILITPDTLPALSIAVAVGSDAEAPLSPIRRHAVSGANVIVIPTAQPEGAGLRERLLSFLSSESAVTLSSIVLSAASEYESGTDAVYASRSVIAECGDILAEAEPYRGGLLYAVIDAERTEQLRLKNKNFGTGDDYVSVHFDLPLRETELLSVRRLPFVPEDPEAIVERAAEILDIQAHGLAGRITRSHSKSAVIGVSGGLDSTLALLVAVRAAEIASLDRKNIIAVTMPCFGTTSRTKSNAEKLAESLGVSLKCIDIKAAVTQHFEDIGHDSQSYNAVYENAQARERTQVLMDIANAEGGIVVGTGDLSELALGWATYNGDHMSMYGVNAGIPKTLLRYLVAYERDLLAEDGNSEAAAALTDILDTPVSPELLPPKDGEIAQCTEKLVGPYELHDFFIYYTVRYGYTPEKILRLALVAHEGYYTEEEIKGWLAVFERRFLAQQFKRSCLPDGPAVGSVSLSPRGALMLPSDASAEEWRIK